MTFQLPNAQQLAKLRAENERLRNENEALFLEVDWREKDISKLKAALATMGDLSSAILDGKLVELDGKSREDVMRIFGMKPEAGGKP